MKGHLKIAFYTDTFMPAVDGVVISIKNFTNELEKRGHSVYIFTAGNDKKIQIMNESPKIFFTRGIKFRKYPQYTFAMFPFFSSLKIRELDIDLIHSHTPFSMGISALTTAKLNKLPLIGSFHTLFTDKEVIKEYLPSNSFMKDVATKYSWKYARFFYNKCDIVLPPSTVIKNLLQKQNIMNTSVVENGIDLKLFNPKVNGKRIRETMLNKKNDKIVLYVGRISKEKRIDTLIKAAKILKNKDILFILIGNGPALDYYIKMVNTFKLNDKVKFLGLIPNEKLPEYYSAADLFCIPSTFETQGIVSLEAMACGKPVVGADYMALSELIKNGKNGEKFVPGNSVDCAKKIEKVINNMDEYKETVATAKNYSVEKTTDKLLGIYKEFIFS
jgi:1,2-diacylglycerol 3-alpha-glucosyltransferase